MEPIDQVTAGEVTTTEGLMHEDVPLTCAERLNDDICIVPVRAG